jgi:flagellar secretion chaperone FliS
MKNPVLAYRQFSVQAATPFGLVVMLYDGVIAALRCAVTAIEAQDIEKKCQHLKRAQAIITQLEGGLDFEQGGEAAKTLKSLYVHVRSQTHRANIENSPDILRSLVENLSTVREAWHQADLRPASKDSTSSPEAASRPKQQPYAATPISEESSEDPYSDREPGSWRISA